MASLSEQMADIDSIARKIIALDAWDRGIACNWAVVAQMEDAPVFVATVVEKRSKDGEVLRRRLLLVPGAHAYGELMILTGVPGMGVASTPADISHFELSVGPSGEFGFFVLNPGFVPRVPTDEERRRFAPILYECLGVFMRMEENPDFLFKYREQEAIFSRTEGLDGKWHDAPLKIGVSKTTYVENIGFAKDAVEKAATLPMNGDWELDMLTFPGVHTNDAEPKILYLFAAVDRNTMERRVWRKLVVESKVDGLKKIWEGHAQRLLESMLAGGTVPASISVRSERMARFIRPLGMKLPFKLVQHSKLPALDAAVKDACDNHNL